MTALIPEEIARAESRLDDGVMAAVGNTPTVSLNRLVPEAGFSLYGKLEGLNPGGSAKDRAARNILTRALREGRLRPGGVVIESSSGNFAIGLAQTCAAFGLRLICVLDARATAQNIAILHAYGARISMVMEPDPATGDFLSARLRRVRELLAETEDSFWPNQYANRWNARAHHRTMAELVASLGRLDYLFCAVSTCGTLRGCAEYAAAHELTVRIVAVDAVGSVLFGGKPGRRLLPGHGASVRPGLFAPGLASEAVLVDDLDCVVGCRRLVRREGILAGASSGGVASAVQRLCPRIPDGAVCAAIFADRGERYLDTVYCDGWVAEHFGDVSHRWDTTLEAGDA